MIDGRGRVHDYLRVSVTDRCNLRCTYCMPATGNARYAQGEMLTRSDVVRLVRIVASLGVIKVRLTGGEPTMRVGLEELIADIATIPRIETVAMTTNGVVLAERAKLYRSAGLGSVNISLDSLDRGTFERITGRDELNRVLAGIEAAIRVGFSPVKVNVVILPGVNDHEVERLVEFTRHRPVVVRFIEHMPFNGNRWNTVGFVPFAKIQRRIEENYELHALPDGHACNGVARDFAIRGFQGSIGFISALSAAFCDRCSRLRVTADGSLKTCLFHPGSVNLRDALRSADDAEIESSIRKALRHKPASHTRLPELSETGDLSMHQIGG